MPVDKRGRLILCIFALFVMGAVEIVALLKGIDGATIKLFFGVVGGIVGFMFGRIWPEKKGD